MVLDEERADIAERLGLNIALDEFPVARATIVVRATPLRLGTAEKSKSHGLLLFLHVVAAQAMDNHMVCEQSELR